MSKIVAVTGATGFIGQALLNALVSKNWNIRALTRCPKLHNSNIQWIQGSLDDTNALTELVSNVDAVVHCAGTVRGNSLEHFVHTNVEGTRNLIKIVTQQPNNPRFLLISSLAAREPQLSWYAKSKYQGEQVLDEFSDQIQWTIFRPTAVYGPGDRELSPLFKTTRLGFLPMTGSPASKFGLLYIDDLVEAIITWLISDVTSRGIYELDDGTSGGYDRYLVKKVARQVWGHPVIIISCPIILIRMLAGINLVLSRVFHYLPMLTPGKVRELSHHDWVCDNSLLIGVLGWQSGRPHRGAGCLQATATFDPRSVRLGRPRPRDRSLRVRNV